MSNFDPHKLIPGTPARMTPEQEEAWATALAKQIAHAAPTEATPKDRERHRELDALLKQAAGVTATNPKDT